MITILCHIVYPFNVRSDLYPTLWPEAVNIVAPSIAVHLLTNSIVEEKNEQQGPKTSLFLGIIEAAVTPFW